MRPVSERLTRNLLGTLRRDPPGLLLLAMVSILVALCLMAPWITAADPTATDFANMLLPPGLAHPLGTDDFGRDVLARLLYGGRASLAIAAVAVVVVMALGVTVGIVAGYFGGAVDIVLTKIVDVLLAFPRLVLAIAVAALMGGGMVPLIIAVSAVAWPAYARIIRAFTLQIRREGYVLAARAIGTPIWKVLVHHVGLNLLGPILVLTMLDLGNLILAISALSFLGLGVAPPRPEWGAMLNEGRAMMELAPWLVLAPGGAIFLVVLAANYFGDIVRDSAEGRPVHGPSDWLRLGRPGARRLPRTSVREPSAAEQPLVALDQVTVDVTDPRSPYFGRRILDGVSVSVRQGECVGLIGESGSGKSTLAALTLGLTRRPLALTAGSVRLFGAGTGGWSWDDWRDVRGRAVCLINQDPLSALNPVLRIGEQIGEVMAVHSGASPKAIEARVREVVREVHLPESVTERYPHELSGGMRQRVVIAMGLVNRPSLLIADEPTTALDVSTQLRILDLLRDLQGRYGLGLLFVSHDLRVVSRVADRVVILKEGRVVEEGPTETVFTTSRQPYTRELMAAIPGRRRDLMQATGT
jgi:peptide/nickel transport system permease protein